MANMKLEIKRGTDHIDWEDVCQMLEQASLGRRDPARLRRAAENSYSVCSAYDGETIVGFGRAISDGEYQSAIYDMVVLPEYQGKQVGEAIMKTLLDQLPRGIIMIYVVRGKEGFYGKFGFWELDTGMVKFHNPGER